ncbi:MAG TPA: carboxypeptidase-like regulatory domain-containing protein [Terriglobia bacterium]|nr:carboxypeptidase-like regulatory domain-containing protein [Terriglobia bacterium]
MKRLLCMALLLGVPLLAVLSVRSVYAQVGADRVAVTGLVTDPSGSAVPDAAITLINQDTSVKTVLASNGVGNFTSPAIILGTYTLQVSKQGFKAYSLPDLALTIGGRTYTQNVALEVGATSQTVEVKASAQLINTQSPTISYQVGKEYYRDLPDVMGADVRLAETKLILSPGYVPTAPNGDAIFRGDAFQSRINGGQTVSWESWFDGAEYGYAEGHQQTHESSIPYAAVQELTTTVNNFSAQYGHTSGGLALYTTKSGTSKLHGNVYDFVTSDNLDASNFFLNNAGVGVLPLTQNNVGIAIGGPIPKVHKWGKTFWFTNYDRLDYHSTVNTGFQNTLPIPAERSGNFSALLAPPSGTLTANGCTSSPCQIGADVLGRPIYYGEIFNPATTRTVSGIPVRDGYGFDPVTGLPTATANMIPANDPLMVGNPAAQKVASLIPALDRNTLFSPNEFGGTSDDNNNINVWTWLMRVDHTFNDKWSASLTYFQNYRPRTAHCGGPQGCTTAHNGETDSQANDTYIGQGFYQLITNHFAHLQINTVIKPNLFNHATLSYDRWVMNGHQLSAGVGWNQKLGLGLPNLPQFNNAGFPSLNFNGGPVGYTSYGTPWTTGGSDINNRYQFYDDLTWITGKHTLKAGLQSEYINFPQTGWAVNTGGSFTFSGLETGGYDSKGNNLSTTGDGFASFLLGQVFSSGFTVPTNYMPKIYYAAPWVNDSFKVTPHLTLDYGLRFDWNSGVSEQHGRFSTFSPTTPNPAAGNHLGATVFGSVANGNSASGIAPRAGFAYQLGQNSVIRGGYGLYYGATIADSWVSYPVDGYTTNPTTPNTTNGEFPAWYFGSGFPSSAITFPPNLSPSVRNGGSPVGVLPNGYEMPIWQNWTVSFQHQWGSNMSLDVAYVGNHGTRLPNDIASLGPYQNMNTDSVLNYGAAVLGARIVNGVPDPVAAAAGITSPYPGYTGGVAQSLRPWPQYQGITWRKPHTGKSHYNSLQVQFKRNDHNSSLTVSYTWSRLMNNGAESGQQGTLNVQDPSNMNDLIGLSSDDVPQILTFGEVYTLPFGKGQRFAGNSSGLVDKIIGNWKISGIASYESGRPLTMFVNNNLGGFLFNVAKFPNVVSGQNPVNPASFSDPFTQRYFNSAAFSIPGPLSFGNSPRTSGNIRGFPYYNEDASIYKDTYFGEQKYVRLAVEGGNIFNRVDFCSPNSNVQSGGFGQTFTQCNIPRRIQIGLQVFF